MPFWRTKLGKSDMFGRVSTDSVNRGLFGVYYDLSTGEGEEGRYLLVTTVSGGALDTYYQLTDEQVIVRCMDTLRGLFPNEAVPAHPLEWKVTRWGSNPCAKMSYSYVGVGGRAEDYDVMSEEDMGGALHFAGEVSI